MYRVAQEALTNVAKHASAEHVQVALRRNGGAVYLEVRDDGVGFDPAAPRGGFGLMGIKERVDLAGGQLDIERASPGTVLRARFPVS